MSNNPVRMVSLNVPEATLRQFDILWKREGWESRQEAIVFLLRQSLARGYISKEKADVLKVISEGGDST
jgi:metal-responsive CopG/Arc/MetJ family transcriptional regulator